MNKKITNYLFLILIVIAIGLLFWAEAKRDFSQTEREEKDSTPVSTEPETENKNYSIHIPDSWEEEIDAFNKIEAAIDVPDCIRKEGFQKASAKIMEINQEDILSLLEEYYHPQKGIEDEQVIQYLGQDNMYLYFSKDAEGEIFEVSLASSFRDYVAMAYREDLTIAYNRDLYPIDKELENFSLEACDAMVSDFCKSIGIKGDINITRRSLDYKTMENEAEELHQDGTRTRPDYQWTSNDNSYYCTISQSCNGISVIPSLYLRIYADVLNKGAHTCLLNSERIVSFHVGDIYDVQYKDDYEELLEFEDILEKYRQYVTISMQDYETVITDITMRVFAVSQGDGNYKMTPVWIFYGYWDDKTEDVTGHHVIFINAVTGERL